MLGLLANSSSCGQGSHSGSSHGVTGYMTKKGTYVAPHRQTNPNKTKGDNRSSNRNVNPYTGKAGTWNPK